MANLLKVKKPFVVLCLEGESKCRQQACYEAAAGDLPKQYGSETQSRLLFRIIDQLGAEKPPRSKGPGLGKPTANDRS
jgi:hypothetical protein